jgi:hypothetical protein
MSERTPVETTNLDRYGSAALPWDRPRDRLAAPPPQPGTSIFLSTTRPDGRPHIAGIGVIWHEGDLYFTSGPGTRKSRNLAANPECVVSAGLKGIDLILEGEATRVDDPALVAAVVAGFHEQGWPAEVEDSRVIGPFNAPSAGPPPWDIYQFRFHTAFGVATAEPFGATRWRFSTT